MATLTLELPPEVYHRLHEEADRLGKPPQVVVQEWLIERLSVPIPVSGSSEREQARQALRAAGLLVALPPRLRQRVEQQVRLEDVEAALARVGGKPLSDIVLEQRGPKG
jgi:aryl-alcohol dehydrogenase-like predicted oxidoreductase